MKRLKLGGSIWLLALAIATLIYPVVSAKDIDVQKTSKRQCLEQKFGKYVNIPHYKS